MEVPTIPALDEPRSVDERQRGPNGAIESLDMPGLQQGVTAARPASSSASASSTLAASGFSISRCSPRSSAARATS